MDFPVLLRHHQTKMVWIDTQLLAAGVVAALGAGIELVKKMRQPMSQPAATRIGQDPSRISTVSFLADSTAPKPTSASSTVNKRLEYLKIHGL